MAEESQGMSAWTRRAIRESIERGMDLGSSLVGAYFLPPDAEEAAVVALYVKRYCAPCEGFNKLDLEPWMGEAGEITVLPVDLPGEKGRRRTAHIIASAYASVNDVNPTLRRLAPDSVQDYVALRGPCVVVVTNAVGELLRLEQTDFTLFAQAFRRLVWDLVTTERATLARRALTGVQVFADKGVIPGNVSTDVIRRVAVEIECERLEWATGVLLPKEGSVASMVPVPFQRGPPPHVGAMSARVDLYLDQPSFDNDWSKVTFRFTSSLSGEETECTVFGNYRYNVSDNPMLNSMLGSSYDTFIRINGPMLLVAVSKDGSLKDLAKEDVPVLCEGMIREMLRHLEERVISPDIVTIPVIEQRTL
ncbi:hypothetical protein CC2G_003071 [Coprinopsis cinerea AmutBmut pab1-1]|nr:hypothetical protein CC2G_003071 [Coprinopsis cinerea AmutBmut pab1-1]